MNEYNFWVFFFVYLFLDQQNSINELFFGTFSLIFLKVSFKKNYASLCGFCAFLSLSVLSVCTSRLTVCVQRHNMKYR